MGWCSATARLARCLVPVRASVAAYRPKKALRSQKRAFTRAICLCLPRSPPSASSVGGFGGLGRLKLSNMLFYNEKRGELVLLLAKVPDRPQPDDKVAGSHNVCCLISQLYEPGQLVNPPTPSWSIHQQKLVNPPTGRHTGKGFRALPFYI